VVKHCQRSASEGFCAAADGDGEDGDGGAPFETCRLTSIDSTLATMELLHSVWYK
jgi:hypothetical protein